MAKKVFQRHIRINGRMYRSPKGLSKLDADLWYQRKFAEKHAHKSGMIGTFNSGPTLGQYFQETWFKKRKKKNPLKSTWGADEQRFLDYVAKEIGAYKISKITTMQIKMCLNKVVEHHGRSTKTRDRVQSLLSKIFRDALNDTPPLVANNPVQGIEFDDPRTGKKEPPHLKKMADVFRYFAAADELSTLHAAYAGLSFFAALRKQEVIPLRWADADYESNMLSIHRRYIQASRTIEKGTKTGSDEGRSIPMPDSLKKILSAHRSSTAHSGVNDFILATKLGNHFDSREISRLNEQICEKSGVKINPHGLRHSFGRFFAQMSGNNMKALQTILGHSNMNVTELYSKLGGGQLMAVRNTVLIEANAEGEEHD